MARNGPATAAAPLTLPRQYRSQPPKNAPFRTSNAVWPSTQYATRSYFEYSKLIVPPVTVHLKQDWQFDACAWNWPFSVHQMELSNQIPVLPAPVKFRTNTLLIV